MAEVRLYRIWGYIKKQAIHSKQRFDLKVKALRPEQALEKVYSLLGSKHKAKRFEIKTEGIQELPLAEEAA